MTGRLSLRKRLGRLITDPKGFSSVIGTTFMVLVMMFLGTSVFLWTLSQNTKYNEAVREKNQLEVDRLNEEVNAFNARYTVYDDGNVLVSAQLQNQGPLSVEIANLWLKDNDIGIHNFTESLNINHLPSAGNSSLAVNVSITGSATGHQFSSWLITGRGNVVPIQPAEEDEAEEDAITRAELAQGLGSLSFNFSTFRYYNVSGDQLTPIPPNGCHTFKVPYGETIAFSFNLTNYHSSNQTITFMEPCVLWSYFAAPSGQRDGPVWYIANVNLTDGSIDSGYSPISLEWGETKMFVFANQAGKWFSEQQGHLGALNLLLYGTFDDGSEYAQNIPFVSIYAE